ncbi:MAG TPA: protein-methionine-sulfoxide reductase heme-binding subunit MsrQ [Bdellovibrionota bacterium]|nr:protein-methionine-sulfoxide reductase heme-binding subunit MsrQ [Bdellovibrionota bacterium]
MGRLSANPLDDITDTTGDWTLRFVVLTLAITPIRKLFHWNALVRYRRMIGLYAFFYGSLHFLTFVVFDHFFNIAEILSDVAKRPFITVGFTAFVIMIPLAITSTNRWVQRLGGKRWQRIHRLIYLTAIGGVIHYLWLVKADIRRPLIYGGIVALLLGYRLFEFARKKLPLQRAVA